MKFNKTKLRGEGLFLLKYESGEYEIVYISKFGKDRFVHDYPNMNTSVPYEYNNVEWIKLK